MSKFQEGDFAWILTELKVKEENGYIWDTITMLNPEDEPDRVLGVKYIDKLKSDNAKLIEALEFYANKADLFEGYDNLDDVSMVSHANLEVEVLGRRARQVLKEIKEG